MLHGSYGGISLSLYLSLSLSSSTALHPHPQLDQPFLPLSFCAHLSPPLPSRLLAVLIRQLGRASANVQRSNASLGIGTGGAGGGSSSDSSSPPPPVAAPVGPQETPAGAEGSGGSPAPSGEKEHETETETETPLPEETPLLPRGMRLRRDEPGRAAAHRDMSVRHSLSLWVSRVGRRSLRSPGACMPSVFYFVFFGMFFVLVLEITVWHVRLQQASNRSVSSFREHDDDDRWSGVWLLPCVAAACGK